MIRFTWIRFRAQAAAGAGVLAVVAVVFAVTGMRLAHSYDAAVALCQQRGNCANLFNVWPSQGYLTADNILGAAGLAVPGLIGMFWGAPLVAREFETGTFRLAWTQGVTRARWLAAKLVIAGVAAMAASELFTLMHDWWASPINKANPGYSPFTSSSFVTGFAPAGYAAFAFALGVTAGLIIRHTLPAMAVTLAIYAAVIIVFPAWVRPHLIPPVQATVALNPTSATNMQITDNNLLPQTVYGPAVVVDTGVPVGSWVLSTSQVVNQDGRPVYSVPAQACAGAFPSQACAAYIASLHLRQTVTYEPASRYWAFQWLETAIYLALALLLAGLCFLRIRPPRAAEGAGDFGPAAGSILARGLSERPVRRADPEAVAVLEALVADNAVSSLSVPLRASSHGRGRASAFQLPAKPARLTAGTAAQRRKNVRMPAWATGLEVRPRR